MQMALSKIRQAARTLLTLDDKDTKRIFEGAALMRRMYRYGFLDESQTKLDYVLALTPADVLERRLQTLVFKLGLAKSIHHARVLIRQRHIRVGKQVVNVPSFMVRVDAQKHIDFALSLALRRRPPGTQQAQGERRQEGEEGGQGEQGRGGRGGGVNEERRGWRPRAPRPCSVRPRATPCPVPHTQEGGAHALHHLPCPSLSRRRGGGGGGDLFEERAQARAFAPRSPCPSRDRDRPSTMDPPPSAARTRKIKSSLKRRSAVVARLPPRARPRRCGRAPTRPWPTPRS